MESNSDLIFGNKVEEPALKVPWFNLGNLASNDDNSTEEKNQNDDSLEMKENQNNKEEWCDKGHDPLMAQYEMLDFKQIYVKHRSKWSHYTKKFAGRSEAQLKNFFHNSLRRLSSQLVKAERNNKIFQKSGVPPVFLHNIIDISLVSKNLAKQDYIINRVGGKILHCLYDNPNSDDSQLLELCKMVRTLHSFIKHMKMIKKFIQNGQSLKKVAWFIIRKEQELAAKQAEPTSTATQISQQFDQGSSQSQMKQLPENEVPKCYLTPQNYAEHWLSPLPFCFYPQFWLPQPEEVKAEVKDEPQNQLVLFQHPIGTL